MLGVLVLVVAAGLGFAAYLGWRAVIEEPWLRGRPLRDLRNLARTWPGRFALLLMAAAVVGGLVGGVLLAAEASRR